MVATYSVMQSDGNSYSGFVVLVSINLAWWMQNFNQKTKIEENAYLKKYSK